MAELNAALAANREAVTALIVAAERSAGTWTTPRAEGKWSPSQVVEHVARALEESAHVVSGTPSKFPTLPSIMRPLLRGMFFNRALRTNVFPKGRTSKAFNPDAGPASPAAARERLESALTTFDHACRAQSPRGTCVSTVFGTLSVADYAQFQAMHTRHHCGQMQA